MQNNVIRKHSVWILLVCVLGLLFKIFTVNSFNTIFFDTDIARDLKEISNIQEGRTVWLGPRLAPGLHASSIYYYLFYPSIILSGGKISGMFVFNFLIGFASLSLFGFFATQKYKIFGALMTLVMGLFPIFFSHISHPGNGFTYIYFSLLSLSFTWFEFPLFLGSLFAGFAIALHPAAVFLMPFLLYEYWRRKAKWTTVMSGMICFLFPLLPLIGFELITKGYIIRNYVSNPSTNNISLHFTLTNFEKISQLLGVPSIGLFILLGVAGIIVWQQKSKRLSAWYSISLLTIVFILFFQNVLHRYLFTIAIIVMFPILISFIKNKLSTLLLIILGIYLLFHSPLFNQKPIASRNIEEIEKVADFISESNHIHSNDTLAVVAALTPQTEVPQADDYRFLLRNRGYKVVEVTENALADTLIMIVEVPGFDWKSWSNWELESFGEKEVRKVENIGTITIVFFNKKNQL